MQLGILIEGLLFTGATVGLVAGLIYFLREVRIGFEVCRNEAAGHG
jgi:hypothetical protein